MATWQQKEQAAATARQGSGDVDWERVGDVRGPEGPQGPEGKPGRDGDPTTIPELAVILDLDETRDLTLLFENGMI